MILKKISLVAVISMFVIAPAFYAANGDNGQDGEKGKNGQDGEKGKNGQDGGKGGNGGNSWFGRGGDGGNGGDAD